MTTVNNNGANGVFDAYALKQQQGPTKKEDMGGDAFMKLMLAQMNNQDPFEPMENGEFLSQLAQFNTVNGIQDLQKSFSDLVAVQNSNQALQASTLVGRSVLVPSQVAPLEEGQVMTATVDLPANTTDMKFAIYDMNGQFVREIGMGQQAAGRINVQWDGKDDSGNAMPAGSYVIAAGAVIDGEQVGLDTYASARVDSVSLGGNGAEPIVNLAGIGSIKFSQVKQIM